MRSRTYARKSFPVFRSMISASTQWALVAWYSNFDPGSQFRRHWANRESRRSRLSHSVAAIGASLSRRKTSTSCTIGNPPMWSITCSTVMFSFPFVPSSGMMSLTFSSILRRPSSQTVHAAAPTIALVQLKIV